MRFGPLFFNTSQNTSVLGLCIPVFTAYLVIITVVIPGRVDQRQGIVRICIIFDGGNSKSI